MEFFLILFCFTFLTISTIIKIGIATINNAKKIRINSGAPIPSSKSLEVIYFNLLITLKILRIYFIEKYIENA